ncbi:MAG TPA: glucose-6-phosphate isomerase family protein [Candidatus Paceibacterota bacterium]
MNQNLEKQTGLPISLVNGKLSSKETLDGLTGKQPQIRTLEELRPYLKNPQVDSSLKNVYLIYRGVSFPNDNGFISKKGLRYDLTVILAGRLGAEFPKTIGHYHETKPGTKLSYPEIYEVISGKALFLFQRIENQNQAKEIYLIKAEPGEKVIVPPGFGHITINIGLKPLIISNVFANGVNSIYSFFKNHQGAAYYILASDPKLSLSAVPYENFAAEKNPAYKTVGKLERQKPRKNLALKINLKKPLYVSLMENPVSFEFLLNPENFEAELTPRNLFD